MIPCRAFLKDYVFKTYLVIIIKQLIKKTAINMPKINTVTKRVDLKKDNKSECFPTPKNILIINLNLFKKN